jgi:uncharacterized membrane protein required for colicin V production
MLDLSCAGIIGLLAFFGWRRGFLLSALSLVGLALGYGLAYLCYLPLGNNLSRVFAVQPLLAYPVAGLLVFILVQIITAILGMILRKKRRALEPRSIARWADRLGGAMVGSVYGALLIVFIFWGLSLGQALAEVPALRPDHSWTGRLMAPWTERLTHLLVAQSSGNEAIASTAVRLSRDPAASMKHLHQVFEEPRVQALIGNPRLLLAIATDQRKVYAKFRVLQALTRDEAFMRKVVEASLLPASALELSPDERLELIVKQVAPLARVVVGMAQDPEVTRLLEDPELAEKLRERNLWALANDPKFNRLATRMLSFFSDEPWPVSSTLHGKASRAQVEEEEGSEPDDSAPGKATSTNGVVYRWKDKHGVIHFADRPPAGKVRYEVVKLKR